MTDYNYVRTKQLEAFSAYDLGLDDESDDISVLFLLRWEYRIVFISFNEGINKHFDSKLSKKNEHIATASMLDRCKVKLE